MIFERPQADLGPLRTAIVDAFRADETEVVERQLEQAALPDDVQARIAEWARALVLEVRERRTGQGGIDSFLYAYELSSEEGVVLMCLAEALLRIPDVGTADRLIRDKITAAQWEKHLGQSPSLFVNASTWALMLTGRVIRLQDYEGQDLTSVVGRLVAQLGEPVIRQAVTQAMRILGRQFVMGRTIEEAIERARPAEEMGYRHSYDMLGEAARTAMDAERYLHAYERAIEVIGRDPSGSDEIVRPGISVKLSALHPRFEFAQRDRALPELVDRLGALARQAMDVGIGLTVDAEEADRLDITLDVFEAVSGDDGLKSWSGLGLAVQAYQKRAVPVIDWLADVARRHRRRILVRLVKGAYWDTEIKRAQEHGLESYPVFTRKTATDVSYIACIKRLLAMPAAFYPQFATHNALTLATVLEVVGARRDFEFQRLHGMGEVLYDQVVGSERLGIACRVYAPTGSHEDLLPYLVRRLLENGANTSFVNRIVDDKLPVEEIIADPIAKARSLEAKPHPRIPAPSDLYGRSRRNARGLDLSDPAVLGPLATGMAQAAVGQWHAAPVIDGERQPGEPRAVSDPSDHRRQIGMVVDATPTQVELALRSAGQAGYDWDATPATARAACLVRMANLMERDMAALMAACAREAGKTVADAMAEVREAIDFCRYYAARARADFAKPIALPGPTGERNEIALHGRGIFACISPWNFPLAIFTGQITVALAAGNTVIAKPAEQTPLIAMLGVALMHEAGVPAEVLHLLPGPGERVGAALVSDPRVAGVAFTGSTDTARAISLVRAQRPGPIVPLIAETGGQNAMIVDSSALPEQFVDDVLTSCFQSAGQRCSALRVLFVQVDIAPRLLDMLAGAMAELVVGDPALLETDVGPVIDAEAQAMLEAHAERMASEAKLLCQVPLGPNCDHRTFFAPRAYEIDRLDRLEREVFGPVLHVIRYPADELDRVIDDINATGYGLTLGIHSRIDETVRYIHRRLRVGNAYVNRNMIGAVVGVQPFGGEGLSSTGPKAGGPRYLHRFATERVLSINTTAAGGNASLLSLQEEPA